MRIFLLEPYYGGSHAAWADGYARHSRHEVHLLTLPARFWKWRMRGAALTLAEAAAGLVERTGAPDLVLASDMLDLPAFLGLTRRFLGRPAVTLYMHENQISYPPAPGSETDHSYGLTNWLSAVSADLVVFNSSYHLDEFFSVLPRLLGSLPDFSHRPSLPEVRERSDVLPVGIDLDGLPPRRSSDGPPVILWNQRWEYDKNPAAFFDALYRLAGEGLDFRVILAGENFRNVPEEFEEARDRLGDRLIHWGFVPRNIYLDLLSRSDIVVSTAHQEFFGVAVVEAIGAGAFPVLPRRLSYPGLIPSRDHSLCLYEQDDGLADRLRWAIEHPAEARRVARRLAATMSEYLWATLGGRYDDRFERVLDEVRTRS